MPGPYIHISSALTTGRRLAQQGFVPPPSQRINPAWTGLDVRAQVGTVMNAGPNHSHVALGAIGPDLFYFLPDFRDFTIFGRRISTSSVLLKVLAFLKSLYDTLDPIINANQQFLGPISENLAEQMSRMTGGLSEQVQYVMQQLSSITIDGLGTLLAELTDWWAYFSLGLNQGYDEQAYLWSDMLHYRRAESLARALVNRAQQLNDDGARAYAFGYMTHVATDVTGHGFVNAVSGGPFRLHWQRHHTVENHMDAHWYLRDPLAPSLGGLYPDFTRSALHFDISFDQTGAPVPRPNIAPTGGTLREKWEWRRQMDIDSSLPDGLAQMIADAIHDIYYDGSGVTPKILPGDGSPTAADIQQAYSAFFAFLKYVTTDGLSHEPPKPPDVFPNLDFPTLQDPAGANAPGINDSGFFHDLLDALLAVLAVILFIVEVAVYLASLPWALAADIVTYPFRLGIYYCLELPLYHLMKTFRSMLVLMGYLSPLPDEISQQLVHIGAGNPDIWARVLSDLSDPFGSANQANVEQPFTPSPEAEQRFADPLYPHLHFKTHPMTDDTLQLEAEFRHPWDYPQTPQELPAAVAGPHGAGAGAEVLFRPTEMLAMIRDGLEAATTPQQIAPVAAIIRPRGHLGDVVSFSRYVIWLLTRDDPQADKTRIPIVEWNLDSDRGYGYHAWDWNRHPIVTGPGK